MFWNYILYCLPMNIRYCFGCYQIIGSTSVYNTWWPLLNSIIIIIYIYIYGIYIYNNILYFHINDLNASLVFEHPEHVRRCCLQPFRGAACSRSQRRRWRCGAVRVSNRSAGAVVLLVTTTCLFIFYCILFYLFKQSFT